MVLFLYVLLHLSLTTASFWLTLLSTESVLFLEYLLKVAQLWLCPNFECWPVTSEICARVEVLG